MSSFYLPEPIGKAFLKFHVIFPCADTGIFTLPFHHAFLGVHLNQQYTEQECTCREWLSRLALSIEIKDLNLVFLGRDSAMKVKCFLAALLIVSSYAQAGFAETRSGFANDNPRRIIRSSNIKDMIIGEITGKI